MITTMLPILQALSRKLKEETTDTSSLRIGYGNDTCKHILSLYKFGWSRKKLNLTVVAADQEYDLTVETTDYSPSRGIYEVYLAGIQIFPCDYNNKENESNRFYLTPDNKSIGFTDALDGTEDIDIWYYPEFVGVADTSSTFNVGFPDSLLEALAFYSKALVHGGKRQRFDERNALLDFKNEVDKIIPQEGSAKIKDRPKKVPNFMGYSGFKRTYSM